MAPPSRSAEWAARLVLASLGAFVTTMAVAMARYPGGTWFDRTRSGHAFWHNFFSDLLHGQSLSGVENPAAPWATVGMLTLVPALGGFWWLLGATQAQHAPRLARACRALGLLGVTGLVAVSLLPTDRFPALHGLAVVCAAGPSLAAAILGTLAQRAATDRTQRTLALAGGLTLVCAITNFALYLHHQYLGAELTPLVPTLQKLSALSAIAWLGASAWLSLRRTGESPR